MKFADISLSIFELEYLSYEEILRFNKEILRLSADREKKLNKNKGGT